MEVSVIIELHNLLSTLRLKTPPATPLFPSLEMENGPELVTQREIPIVQPLSRVCLLTVILSMEDICTCFDKILRLQL